MDNDYVQNIKMSSLSTEKTVWFVNKKSHVPSMRRGRNLEVSSAESRTVQTNVSNNFF